MKDWLSTWAWVIVLAILILAAVVLPALKWLTVITWPWSVVLFPFYVLIGLFCWALIGFNQMMQDGWH